eukprot:363516-Chlamydomonas_euryale.AAC.18
MPCFEHPRADVPRSSAAPITLIPITVFSTLSGWRALLCAAPTAQNPITPSSLRCWANMPHFFAAPITPTPITPSSFRADVPCPSAAPCRPSASCVSTAVTNATRSHARRQRSCCCRQAQTPLPQPTLSPDWRPSCAPSEC